MTVSMESYNRQIASELSIRPTQVASVRALFDDSATVPFIARYRKEVTGSLDEVTITSIRDRLSQLLELDKRLSAIVKSLEQRSLLNPDLQNKITTASTLVALEDVYLPYRPKRRTRATIAKENGLEPLAHWIMKPDRQDLPTLCRKFIRPEKDVHTTEDALSGARDIISEKINERSDIRGLIRNLFLKTGIIQSKVVKDKEKDAVKYRDYFDWSEPISKAPSHRLLAMFRAESEGFIKLKIGPDKQKALLIMEQRTLPSHVSGSLTGDQLLLSIEDAYKRLMRPSIENEVRKSLKEKADHQAIQVFAENLKQLLMAAPMGQKNVLAVDPGFRTGCKIVCLNRQGKLEHHGVVYIGMSALKEKQAAEILVDLTGKFNIQAIAVGNGTGGREAEKFIRKLNIKTREKETVPIVLVNESGASIYSASEAAREEFPHHDVTVRGSVSIGRRLMDPLAELVKIDPKSIGVGQYQHDVNQTQLKKSLDDVVEVCVNAVGVNLNTASKQLLTYVSGLGPKLAENIILYRNDHGAFKNRVALKKVPLLGAKAFQQCAGFLSIPDGNNPLDKSAVHPESYGIVKQMALDLDCSIVELMASEHLRKNIIKQRYVTNSIGLPTLIDIVAELARPGLDPRDSFDPVVFRDEINKPEDLEINMKLTGIVTNVTNFGAFVDIGVHQDGLVHISQMADRYISNPNDVVKVNQKVRVSVLDVDLKRRRISLSMKNERS